MDTTKFFIQGAGATSLLGWTANDQSEKIFNTFCNFGLTDRQTPLSTGIYYYITASPAKIIQFLASFQTMHNRRRKVRVKKSRVQEIAQERFDKIPRYCFAGYSQNDANIDGLHNLEGDFGGCDSSCEWENYIEKCVLG